MDKWSLKKKRRKPCMWLYWWDELIATMIWVFSYLSSKILWIIWVTTSNLFDECEEVWVWRLSDSQFFKKTSNETNWENLNCFVSNRTSQFFCFNNVIFIQREPDRQYIVLIVNRENPYFINKNIDTFLFLFNVSTNFFLTKCTCNVELPSLSVPQATSFSENERRF